jgi:hypothetical protein
MTQPKFEPLILSRGVRPARADEVPGEADPELLARMAAARLLTGYVLAAPPAPAGYTAFLEANVHAPRVWNVFRELAEALLPDIAAPISA